MKVTWILLIAILTAGCAGTYVNYEGEETAKLRLVSQHKRTFFHIYEGDTCTKLNMVSKRYPSRVGMTALPDEDYEQKHFTEITVPAGIKNYFRVSAVIGYGYGLCTVDFSVTLENNTEYEMRVFVKSNICAVRLVKLITIDEESFKIPQKIDMEPSCSPLFGKKPI